MRHEVEIKSSQYLSGPDGSNDKEGLPVLEQWDCWQVVHLDWPQPGGEGDCHLCPSLLELCQMSISCVSNHPETVSNLAAQGPLGKT